MIYVGEYLHGERSGRGTEYDPENENEIYEGEYLYGERNGKGTEYQNREIIFEGEYKNGKRYEGMEYWNYYDVIFIHILKVYVNKMERLKEKYILIMGMYYSKGNF